MSALIFKEVLIYITYKGTQITCEDFNQFAAVTETISLLVGFSLSQVQYLNLNKDTSKLFNEE